MKIPFYTIDAFTSEPFSGNPAAVCPLEADISDDVKQSIATEMNISETCYITKESENPSIMRLCDENFCRDLMRVFRAVNVSV